MDKKEEKIDLMTGKKVRDEHEPEEMSIDGFDRQAKATVSIRQSVDRKIPSNIRVLSFMLYFCVALFTIIGTTRGFFWLFPTLGTLFLCWYMVGEARITYEYQLDDHMLHVVRTSGMRSRQKSVSFLTLDLRNMVIMAEEGLSLLDEAEAASRSAVPRRITYDVSAHDKNKGCYVIYAAGTGAETGRSLRVFFSPGPQLREHLRLTYQDKVHISEEFNLI